MRLKTQRIRKSVRNGKNEHQRVLISCYIVKQNRLVSMIETYEKRGVGGDCLRTGGMTRDFHSLRECVTTPCRRFGSNPFRCKKRVSFRVLTLFQRLALAERGGTEPKHPTAYKSVFYFPIFQIGNETVTIFINAFVRLCPLFVCLSHGFKDTTLFRITQMPEYKCFHVGARCKLYI